MKVFTVQPIFKFSIIHSNETPENTYQYALSMFSIMDAYANGNHSINLSIQRQLDITLQKLFPLLLRWPIQTQRRIIIFPQFRHKRFSYTRRNRPNAMNRIR